MLRQSMTGFASHQGSIEQSQGADHALSWQWELRGVNAKGLDIRVRLPDWIDGLEPLVRKAVSSRLTRGNVQIALRVHDEDTGQSVRVDEPYMLAVLEAMNQIEAAALDRGLSLQPSTAAEIVSLRGLLTSDAPKQDVAIIRDAVFASFETALASFCESRQSEGAALLSIMTAQLDEIEDLVGQANTLADDRELAQKARLQEQLQKILGTSEQLDENRIAQELALIVVKLDVTEEIDRLRAHIVAARDLLKVEGAVGRKLDFLMQEFNREANTLCSKSQNSALTQVGLSLKTVIDQMREQVQNVE